MSNPEMLSISCFGRITFLFVRLVLQCRLENRSIYEGGYVDPLNPPLAVAIYEKDLLGN